MYEGSGYSVSAVGEKNNCQANIDKESKLTCIFDSYQLHTSEFVYFAYYSCPDVLSNFGGRHRDDSLNLYHVI